MNYKYLLVITLLVSASVFTQPAKKEELQIEDDGNAPVAENKPKYEVKSDLDLPQFAGAKFIEEITAEDFEGKTKDTGSQ